jgi:hypothetical protein
MKVFKSWTAAKKAAGDQPIIRIGKLLVVGATSTTEVAVINQAGPITGHITVGHLDRLGNGNWAKGDSSQHGYKTSAIRSFHESSYERTDKNSF